MVDLSIVLLNYQRVSDDKATRSAVLTDRRTPGMDLIRQFHYDNEARHWPTGAVFAVEPGRHLI